MTDAAMSRLACGLVAAGALALAAGAWRAERPAATAALTVAVTPTPTTATTAPRAHAGFGTHDVSADARRLAEWAAGDGDARGRPFMIVDKRATTLYVFDAAGRLVGTAPVLLGAARGDDSVPGIGQRPIAVVRPFERTTPAGRFVTAAGRNLDGEPVLWIDHGAAVSMHRVRATVAGERRLQRLASPSAADNRISYGCINVPVPFYDSVVWPAFSRAPGITYVLPETRPLHEVFEGLPAAAGGALAVPARPRTAAG
jgi:hypothetical protein